MNLKQDVFVNTNAPDDGKFQRWLRSQGLMSRPKYRSSTNRKILSQGIFM